MDSLDFDTSLVKALIDPNFDFNKVPLTGNLRNTIQDILVSQQTDKIAPYLTMQTVFGGDPVNSFLRVYLD